MFRVPTLKSQRVQRVAQTAIHRLSLTEQQRLIDLLLTYLMGCERKSTEEALVRVCQQRNVQGEFKCEMDKKNPQF